MAIIEHAFLRRRQKYKTWWLYVRRLTSDNPKSCFHSKLLFNQLVLVEFLFCYEFEIFLTQIRASRVFEISSHPEIAFESELVASFCTSSFSLLNSFDRTLSGIGTQGFHRSLTTPKTW